MARLITIGLVVSLAASLTAANALAADLVIPDPPAQGKPFVPPAKTKLSPEFISATAALFDLGLPDPRGCEYREVQIGLGGNMPDNWGHVKVHAWVLPLQTGAPENSPRYAVAWNGLVYPVAEVGAKVDLKADIDAACEAEKKAIAKWIKDYKTIDGYQCSYDATEQATASEQTVQPIKACLLLRLGETALAERVWQASVSGDDPPEAAAAASAAAKVQAAVGEKQNGDNAANAPEDANKAAPENQPYDPFPDLAGDWLLARFNRLLASRVRGDELLALADARALGSAGPKAESLAKKRGLNADENGDDGFDFIKFVPPLLADQERRCAEKPRVHVFEAGLDKFPNQAERIAALIADLDQIRPPLAVDMDMQTLDGDPIVRALVREGGAAVEPLLQCLEKDNRLTRAVIYERIMGGSFGSAAAVVCAMHYSHLQSLVPVHDAAFEALSKIFDEHFPSPDPVESSLFEYPPKPPSGEPLEVRAAKQRAASVREIRNYWTKYGRFSPLERSYAILADDDAGPELWESAANKILYSTRVSVHEMSQQAPYEPAGDWKRPGEPLRKRAHPSVSELLAKRLRSFADLDDEDFAQNRLDGQGLCNRAMGLVYALALWDGKQCLPTLRAFCEDLQNRADHSGEAGAYLENAMGAVLLQRAALGDEKAIDEYVASIELTRQDNKPIDAAAIFKPLLRFAVRPSVARLAEKMFSGPNALWDPLGVDHFNVVALSGKSVGGLMSLPAFRKELLRLLGDESPAGKCVAEKDGSLSITIPLGGQPQNWQFFAPDDGLPPPQKGVALVFRKCDYAARVLSGICGFPRIELYWPKEKCDAAVEKCAALLRQHGDGFNRSHEQQQHDGQGNEVAVMTFPRLDHPATAQDVAQGRAIFSLEGQRRVWPMPSRPIAARWNTLRTIPFRNNQGGKQETIWLNDGYIWQAEELLVDGKWVRWYGFVGPGFIGKAPASEVEFDHGENYFATEFADGIASWLDLPDKPEDGQELPLAALAGPKPFRAEMRLQNLRGVGQAAPSPWYRPADGALAAGVEFHFQRAKDDANESDLGSESVWTDMVPKKPWTHFVPEKSKQTLDAGEQFTPLSVDLRKLYTIDRPGHYRVWIVGPRRPGQSEPPETDREMFTLTEAANK